MLGRSQLLESLVWLTPFLCVKKREKREKRREKMREKMKREDERENEQRKRVNEMKEKTIFSKKKKSLRSLKPARWVSQKMFRKNPFRTNYSSIFLRKFRILPFFNYLHDSNSIFRVG